MSPPNLIRRASQSLAVSSLILPNGPLLSPSLEKVSLTETQFPVLIGLDNSPSMVDSGGIEKLKAIIPVFLKQIRAKPTIRASVLMQFATFGETSPLKMAGPFCPVHELSTPDLALSPGTPLCGRILAEIDLLIVGRKLVGRQFNADQRHSWLIEMTDGEVGDSDLKNETRHAIHQIAVENNIEVHLFGVGKNANLSFLNSISQPQRPAQQLETVEDFTRLFDWLSKSVDIISASAPGQSLEIPAIDGTLIPTQERK